MTLASAGFDDDSALSKITEGQFMAHPLYAPQNLVTHLVRTSSPGGQFFLTATRLTDNTGAAVVAVDNWTDELRDLQKQVSNHEYTSLWSINGEVVVVFEGTTINPFMTADPMVKAQLIASIRGLMQQLQGIPCRIILPEPEDVDNPGLTLWCVLPALAFSQTMPRKILSVLDSAMDYA